MSNNGAEDKIKGAGNKAKGAIKDTVGDATNNRKIQADGKKDKIKGEAQDAKGDAKNKAND
ncbi:CsbD family protein [Shouchella patagoniensis]|uniref:CsbD family protein n=1 Tax=Shouchella patagoniensis TaxID=228576 RepID=UPI000995D327|nr:CsbD family protein [Shouchella patagoniensis]